MQDSICHAWASNVCRKSPPTTVAANPGPSPMKKRGPRHPQKYPNPNDMPATGNIQQYVSVNVGENQADDFVLVKAGIWYRSTHYELVKVWNGATSWKRFYGIGYVDECQGSPKNPPPWAVWLTSISAQPCEKIPCQLLCFLYCSPCTTDDILMQH